MLRNKVVTRIRRRRPPLRLRLARNVGYNCGEEKVMMHYIVVREDGAGRFVAHPCGIPELAVTATGRAEAITAATARFNDWIIAGRLVPVRLPGLTKVPSTSPKPPSESDEYMQR